MLRICIHYDLRILNVLFEFVFHSISPAVQNDCNCFLHLQSLSLPRHPPWVGKPSSCLPSWLTSLQVSSCSASSFTIRLSSWSCLALFFYDYLDDLKCKLIHFFSVLMIATINQNAITLIQFNLDYCSNVKYHLCYASTMTRSITQKAKGLRFISSKVLWFISNKLQILAT